MCPLGHKSNVLSPIVHLLDSVGMVRVYNLLAKYEQIESYSSDRTYRYHGRSVSDLYERTVPLLLSAQAMIS